MVSEIVPSAQLYICRLIRAAVGGNQNLIVRLVGIADIIYRLIQRSFDRVYLCNCHIFSNAPFISSKSSL